MTDGQVFLENPRKDLMVVVAQHIGHIMPNGEVLVEVDVLPINRWVTLLMYLTSYYETPKWPHKQKSWPWEVT